MRLYNHRTGKLSAVDMAMVRAVPSGGNWRDIPASVPSKRLEQIRRSGGRTTYYGRLQWDRPAYTINTYFSRPGNGCFMHPEDGAGGKRQDRLISLREAARLQSFPDAFRFAGPPTSIYRQIGNAVPPLLGRAIAMALGSGTCIDLFAGAGGLSRGFELAGWEVVAGLDIDRHSMETWADNHDGEAIVGDIADPLVMQQLDKRVADRLAGRPLDAIIGGPPCQGFSLAGWRNSTDPRNLLWNEYLRVVKRFEPRFFVIENVPGLLSAGEASRDTLARMQEAFSAIGYSFVHRVLRAEDYGVPQLRRRIFIVGTRTADAFHFPERMVDQPFTVRDAISNLPSLVAGGGVDQIEFTGEPQSDYQAWLMGRMGAADMLATRAVEHSEEQVMLPFNVAM